MRNVLARADICAFTETHAASDGSTAELVMPSGYGAAYHCVRTGPFSGRGGAAAYVRAGLSSHTQLVGLHRAPGFESVWIRVSRHVLHNNGHRDLLVGVVYASPSNSSEYTRGAAGGPAVEGLNLAGSECFARELQLAIQRFKQPTDMLLLAGDFNARVHNMVDTLDDQTIAVLADLDRSNLAPPVVPADYTGIPPRQSADRHHNSSGRVLCHTAILNGMVILNGRVAGDVPGVQTFVSKNERGGGSMIDLYLADTDLFRMASRLSVHAQLFYPGRQSIISDHRPVLLDLKVLNRSKLSEGSTGSRASGRPVKPKARLDDSCWREYASCFDDSMLAELQQVQERLDSPQPCTTTEACNRISTVVRCALSKYRRRGVRTPLNAAGQPQVGRQFWWNSSCADAQSACLAFVTAATRGVDGRLDLSEDERTQLRALRATYKRVCREARREHSAAVVEQLLRENWSDPWAVFRRLSQAPRQASKLSGPDVWAAHGHALHGAAAAPVTNTPLAHRILNLINLENPFGALPVAFGNVSCDPMQWRLSTAVLNRQQTAVGLNAEITEQEVAEVLDGLALGKACGPDGIPGEALRCARFPHATKPHLPGERVLSKCLTSLFRCVFDKSDYPCQFCLATWSPLPKSGNTSLPSNNRGIAVGNVPGKVFSSICTRRISNWASANPGVRHAAQAGFMRGMSVSHQHFIMRHLITRYSTCPPRGTPRRAPERKPLFVCQIDFAKAFDRVPHDLLWERLFERGIHGRMLDTLKNAYANVMLCPQVNGVAGEPFRCAQGVKQGDPASPDLFGLYIEILGDFIDAMDKHKVPVACPSNPSVMLDPCVEDAPVLDGINGPVRAVSLLFADDVNLLALSAGRMNYLMALLAVFCDAFGMSVNTSKSELLIFHASLAERERLKSYPVCYRGAALTPTYRVRYLGLYYGPPGRGVRKRDSLFVDCWRELLLAGKLATRALIAKLAANGLSIPHTMLELYNACVRSVFSFGAQVWSTRFLTCDFATALKHDMVSEQRNFLRRVLGAQRPSNAVLYMEMSQLPFQHHWAGLVLRFWNDLAEGAGSRYCHGAFRSDIRMCFERRVGWVHDVITFLRSLNVPGLELPSTDTHSVNALVDHYSSMSVPVDEVLTLVANRLHKVWMASDLPTADPRVYQGPAGASVCRYMNWMGTPDDAGNSRGGRAPLVHAKLAIARERHMCLMRFRTCTWDLQTNRSYGGARPRGHRVCRLCVEAGHGEHVEDEKHVLVECACHGSLRNTFADLPFGEGMLAVMRHPDQKRLADYVCKLKDALDDALDRSICALACDTCGSTDNARDMLLCDGRCCRAFHLQCCTPHAPRPARHVPWFCPDCTAVRDA